MGWDCGPSPRGGLRRMISRDLTTTDFRHEVSTTVLKLRRGKDGHYYAAVRYHDHRDLSQGYLGVVVLVEKKGEEVCTKTITEAHGPVAAEAPAEVIAALAGPPPNAEAGRWRERCRRNAKP